MSDNIKTLVLYASLHSVDTTAPLYPDERYREILTAKNGRVKCEKYLVWKLLEAAVTMGSNLKFANLQFTKTANGKWICPDFYFSLSHSDGVVCAAISNAPIGVDVESMKEIKHSLADKILTESEQGKMASLPESDRSRFILDAWVKKESIFKMQGGASLLPMRTESSHPEVKTYTVEVNVREYLLSVASKNDNIEIIYTEEL